MPLAITPTNLRVEVVTPGTPVQVTADTGIVPQGVYFEAHKNNVGFILVMRSSGNGSTYMAKLSAGDSFQLGAATGQRDEGGHGIQLSDIYIDAENAAEAALVTYLPR